MFRYPLPKICYSGTVGEISERLKQLRDQKGYSQEGIASSIDMKQTTWADWEKHPPEALVRLKKLAEKYQVSADYLLGLTDDPTARDAPALGETVQEILVKVKQLAPARQRDVLRIIDAFMEQGEPGSPSGSPRDKALGRKPDAPHIIGGEE